MSKIGWSKLACLMVMEFFQQKSEYTKVSYRYLKNFEQKKMPKNFDQSESWKIKFHRHQKYVPFESTCSIEFKTGLGLKIGYVVLEKLRN